MRLKGKNIILGITGSIAAYKAAILLRLLVKEGAEVQVVITAAGKEFITPVTLSALSGKPVVSECFGANDGTWNSHVDLGLWADLMVIAPATATTMGKMANGIADNMLVTTYMSAKCPVLVAPAMDLDMFAHPSTQKNISVLKEFGNHIIEPGFGELASGLEGKGRMEEPENIVENIVDHFNRKKKLLDKTFLVTAGPTFEKIDPIRFIGNYSSGKMGYALAEELANNGADVLLISGPVALSTNHPKIKVNRLLKCIPKASIISRLATEQLCAPPLRTLHHSIPKLKKRNAEKKTGSSNCNQRQILPQHWAKRKIIIKSLLASHWKRTMKLQMHKKNSPGSIWTLLCSIP